MTKTDIYAEWHGLCEEYKASRDAHFQAFSVLNQKFASVAQSASSINPTDEELTRFETTWKALEDVKYRMTEFVKLHA